MREKMHEEAVCQNKQEKSCLIDESPPFLYLHLARTHSSRVMSDVPNSRLSRKRHNKRVGNKLAYRPTCYFKKTMIGELSVGGLLQAVLIYSYVQTQAKLVSIMFNMFILIMSDLCVLSTQ